MSRLMLALVALAAIGAGAWWLSSEPSGSDDPASAARPQAAPTRDARVDAPPTGPLEVAAADANSVGERSAAALPAPAPPPQGLEDGGPAAPVSRDFSGKYKDLDEAELRRRLDGLELQVLQALDVAILPRFADGRFVEHRIEREDRRGLAKVLEDYGANDPWCRVWPMFDPAGASNATAQQQLIAVRVVCLSRSEHPNLADLMDERTWLRGQLIPSGR